MEKILKKGAEASIYHGKWFGAVAIYKIRLPKHFRQQSLDIKLRALRTRHEALFLSEAKRLGVTTPLVYFVDKKQAEIVMQFIPGRRLKEIIDACEEEMFTKWCREAGRYIARLHGGAIIHGDLTTSNFIISNDKIILIDFGLSFYSHRLEDKAIDLHLLNMVAKSAHSIYSDKIIDNVLQGYREVAGESILLSILEQLSIVELRGRYKRVE